MKKGLKKIVSSILIVAITLCVGMPASADSNRDDEALLKETITIDKDINSGLYLEIKSSKKISKDNMPLEGKLDKSNGLYEITSDENVYLQPLGNGEYLPMEKNIVGSVNDLEYVNANYNLTEIEEEDIASLLQENENIDLIVYAPSSSEITGTYDGKKYRFVKVQARDNQTGFQIGKGANIESLAANTVMYAISTLGSSASIGITITNAVLGLLNVDYQLKSDSTCIATKNENVTFQYLDFFEVGSAYITRGLTSVGTITITTKTTCWVKQSNGNYVNEPIYGKPVSGTFGKSETGNSLASKCVSYFEDYSGIGPMMYENYTTKFKIDFFNSIPAISPKR